jgi:hypothetical protein
VTKNPRTAIKEEALCLIWAKEMKMKKLTVALVIVMLLTLPVVGLAEGKSDPPQPGTRSNPGLIWAGYFGYINSDGANLIGICVAGWLWYWGAPPWFAGK